MSVGYQQILPDLAEYRAAWLKMGFNLPLSCVPWRTEGLLRVLPRPLSPFARQGWPWERETPPFASAAADWPLITIVTPSYQQGEYLEETLRSVLLQNYPRLEFIVIDGGSTDASRTILERYRPWLSFARSERDRGQSHAINRGFSLGSGEIFGWINSDDFYLPGTLQRVAQAWRNGAEFIHGDLVVLEQSTEKLTYVPANLARSRYVRFPGLVAQATAFWSADRHQPLWEEQHCALDYELWIRLLPGLRLSCLREPLALARSHEAAKTSNPAMKQQWDADGQRNGLAHPRLYETTVANWWLQREYKLVQRFQQFRQKREIASRLATLQRTCGWPDRSGNMAPLS